MDKVIVAFESARTGERVREVMERAGAASCLVCRTAAEVKRLAGKRSLTAVICGFKLPDQTAEDLFEDLPAPCSMLLIAPQSQLDLCENEEICRLPAPVSRGDLIASVRMLLQMGRRLEKYLRPRRSGEEEELIRRAKALLMERNGMTEEQAHRFLQKQSMDAGARLADTARLVLEGQ